MKTNFPGLLVGVAGKKQHGKDTVADWLCLKYKFTKLSFADPLKQIIGKQLLYLTDEQLEDGPAKEEVDPRWGKSPRKLIQIIGTEMFREMLDTDFWVKRSMYRVAAIWAKDPQARLVISDVRFPNELDACAKVGKTIKIERPDLPTDDTHKSEMALNSLDDRAYDKVIKARSGELDYIYYEVDTFMEGVLRDAI